MKLGLKTLLAAALAAALVVPAATAKPSGGHGQGHGGGKPSWAGQGKAHGKKAEKAAKPEKAHKAHKSKGSASPEDATAETDAEQADAPKHDNPAWTCKFERDMMGDEEFAAKYGDHPNAFGKCVSAEAHARDGVSEEAQPDQTESCDVSEEDIESEKEQAEAVEGADGAAPADAEECAAPDETGDGEVEDAEAGEEEETTSEGSESPDVDALLTALRLLF